MQLIAALSMTGSPLRKPEEYSNIRINTITPGLTTTELSDPGGFVERMQMPFIPMGRPGS